MDTMRKRQLWIRTTTTNGSTPTGTVAAVDVDGEVVGEPVSPSARLVDDLFIVVSIGFASPANLSVFRAGILASMACHPRFHSIQAADKDGILRWVPTTVSVDHHVFSPTLDPAAVAADPDLAVEDYVASLYTRPMDHSRPLWEFHLLDFPTSEATSTAVARVHHSLGDGMSLLTLLLACSRSAADPTRLPAMPPPPRRTGATYAAHQRPPASAGVLPLARWLWCFVLLAWHTLADVAVFFATILFLKDTRTLFTAVNDHGPKRVVHRGLSLQDVKAVKEAMKCTVNDVLVGVTNAALSRYYYRKSGDGQTVRKDIRLRSILPVNLRPTTSLHACVNMIESGKASHIKWGNQIGFILLPLHIAMHSDPLDYVRKAKITVDRKKSSFEVAFTHLAAEVFFKLFGPKAGTAIFDRMISHTTTSLSSMVGPVEHIEFCGHPTVFIAPTTYVPQEAIVVNYQSYVNTVRVVLSVDEAQFPDCHELLDDFVESLKHIKDATIAGDML